MCDCAEELERRERAKAEELERALADLRAQSERPPSMFSRLLSCLTSFGSGGCGGSSWIRFIGSSAFLLGMLGFLYKNFGAKLKMMYTSKSGKVDPCDRLTQPKKPKEPPKPILPCQCD